VSIKL